MDAIKKYCPTCNKQYQLKPANSKIPNIPLFLACGHCLCENCIRHLLNIREPIKCKICLKDMQVSTSDTAMLRHDKISLHKLFPINVYMVGELTLQDIEPKGANKGKIENENFIDIKSLLKNTELNLGECLECHGPTSKMCQQCDILLCDGCFNKTHIFSIFKNHTLQNIEATSQKDKKDNCNTHRNKPLDYYCKECTTFICMDCMMVGGERSCKNHNVTTVQEMNETLISEIADLTPKVDETLRRLTKTAVDIGNSLTKIDVDPSSEYMILLDNVEQHFSKIIRVIQNQKDEITSKLIEVKNTEKESLQEAKNHVAEAIKKAKITLNAITLLDPSKMMEMNIAALLEDIKHVINTPWYLKHEAEIKMNISVKEDLYSLLNDFIKLEGDSNLKYKLYSTTELIEKNEDIPAAPTSIVYPKLIKDVWQPNKQKPKEESTKQHTFVKDIPTYRSKNGSCSSLNSINSASSRKSYLTYEHPQVEPVMPVRESEPKQLCEGNQEMVYISHIVDPHCLYVQRVSQQGKLKELQREFRNAVSLPKPAASHVAEGKVYLVYDEEEKLWRRGRVLRIDRTDVNYPQFHMFCFDFGCTKLVSLDELRLLPPGRVQSPPPLATNCRLANCEPIHGSWTSDDSLLVQNIIDNGPAVVHVRRVVSASDGAATLECDIATFDHGVNLAQALVFHGRALIPDTVTYPNMKCLNEKPKIFINSSDYKQNTVEEVYISHVVSPDNFFVRKRHYQKEFEKLCKDLNQEYSTAVNTGYIYLPEKDMVCVANVEKCGLGAEATGAWARAVVLGLPGRGRARLLLPDTGARVLVHWSALRRIQDEFTVLKSLAAECHLAGVAPPNGQWSAESVQLLESLKGRLLELHVEDYRNPQSLGIALYDKSDRDNVISINTEMVVHKFAYTFGIYKFNKNKTELVCDEPPADGPKPSSSVRRPENMSGITTMNENRPVQRLKETAALKAKDKGPLRVEVKLLDYRSPALIYVSLMHRQREYEELFENIRTYYTQNRTQGRRDWRQSERCCVQGAQSQAWRRAVVRAVDGESATVFYADCARTETVPLAGLRDLPPEFAAVDDAAVACHLAGVLPAGGDCWPSITKEYLGDLLDAYDRLFIAKCDGRDGESVPVELWVYHTEERGALEPNISEWRCLNTRLIHQGLALPDYSEKSRAGEVASADTGNDVLPFMNVAGSVEPEPEGDEAEPEGDEAEPEGDEVEPEGDGVEPFSPTAAEEEEPHCSDAIYVLDWLPPEPLPQHFHAVPTHIDDDGAIYLNDVSQRNALEMIRRALDTHFKHPDPEAVVTEWTVGEPCVALFCLDDRFYRGRVLQVHDETSSCLIQYIDFGNEEMCSFENLRKSIILPQIPTQAHKCVLDGIRPVDENWDRQTLDYVYQTVVEKKCFVKIRCEPIGDLIPIDLIYNDQIWINVHLVDLGMAVYADSIGGAVRKLRRIESKSDDRPERSIESLSPVQMHKDCNELIQEEKQTRRNRGRFVTFPHFTETEFMCDITMLNEKNIYELSVCHNRETRVMYKNMQDQLQADICETALDGIYVNKACVALFPEDGQWYRATIRQYSEAKNLIKVKYVDFGNIEVIALNNVREIRDDYLKLPPAVVTATLHGVQVNPNVDQTTLLEKMTDTLVEKDPFHVKVIERDVIPSVELRDADGNLVYDNLIEEDIFLKCD